ncbi:MAG: hypothetical protein IJ349_04070 [Clostridia bacterium]|nr:hypothetical protein [Clostridia bacterium]
MTISSVFEQMTVVYQAILSMFTSMVTTITGNPLLYVPVLFALLGGLVLFSIRVIRKLGIRGISSAGRRRR